MFRRPRLARTSVLALSLLSTMILALGCVTPQDEGNAEQDEGEAVGEEVDEGDVGSSEEALTSKGCSINVGFRDEWRDVYHFGEREYRYGLGSPHVSCNTRRQVTIRSCIQKYDLSRSRWRSLRCRDCSVTATSQSQVACGIAVSLYPGSGSFRAKATLVGYGTDVSAAQYFQSTGIIY